MQSLVPSAESRLRPHAPRRLPCLLHLRERQPQGGDGTRIEARKEEAEINRIWRPILPKQLLTDHV